jgi:Ca-activated chloride channel family protein
VVGGGPAGPRRVRQRLPGALLIAGFGILALAMGRPQGVISLPRLEGTVILAFDVSGSMAATDFQPTRMEAAKVAAREFVARQPTGVVIGVVAFSDGGLSIQAPTSDHDSILAAIGRLAPERGTSLGQGILTALQVIDIAEHPPDTNFYSSRTPPPTPEPTPVPAGVFAPATIVLLTDGEHNVDPDPLEVAVVAAQRGVRIHAIGIGRATSSGCTPGSTRHSCSGSRRSPMARTTRPPTRPRWTRSTGRWTHGSSWPMKPWSSPPWRWAWGSSCSWSAR